MASSSRSQSRPASGRSTTNNNDGQPLIGKLDYHPGGRPLLHAEHDHDQGGRASSEHSYAGSFFSDIAEGIASEQRHKINKQVIRYFSFAWAILMCLGAGSLTAYSLYAPLFQRRLHYTQLQVNGVSIASELAMYLPVPLFGLLCDRAGPGIPSLLAGCLFGSGYLVAAFAYKSGPPPSAGGDGWPYWVMVLAFIPIGCATSCMYMSAVTTCAKNFGRGKYKGLAVALPIACVGLSGMWQSQVGSHLLYERRPDGTKGDVDVHRFFLFLGCFLLSTGAVGFFALRVVDEEELIDDALGELEASGLLEDSEYFQHRAPTDNNGAAGSGYGTVATGDRRLSAEGVDEMDKSAEEHRAWLQEQERKKTWLLNEETRRFLSDHTLWWLAAGFLLVTGPGEAFVNNLGTIIGTLYPPATSATPADDQSNTTTAAAHVSIFAITSTLARILAGTVTDLLAPTSSPHQHRRRHAPDSMANSQLSALHEPQLPPPLPPPRRRLEVSRMTFMLAFSLLTSLGQVTLASGVLQNRGHLFWLVSASTGAGYGAVFSLTPIIVSVVWGVENFGTNWGVLSSVPALGATAWGLVYSGVYQWAAARDSAGVVAGGGEDRKADVLCYGVMCYAPTFWAMAGSVWIACGLWIWAWRGPGGWKRRGIAV
ncbi:hypothetical protein LTR36_001197 [Oleoguttula mirabilis]|uniref:Probable transporter MCH1 n=1 Tax=Oleoguttula mirabilis TaxID=1507867 RepID=A0AAV9J3K1_9PEZI|nr:hypothetical protein LTR36_001197 [Oleoguttula mirabilis]